jgi:OmpA-OmpF porin, OOP family
MKAIAAAAVLAAAAPGPALAQSAWDIGKKVVGKGAAGQVEKQVNKRLLEESRRNQCSFKTDSDVLEKGCDPKAKRLANALVDAKKKLNAAGVKNFKFEVSGHTDTSGSAAHNQELSEKRAAAIRRELERKGVAADDIVAVGVGANRPLVKPDDTPAKKARNRRYEIQVRL